MLGGFRVDKFHLPTPADQTSPAWCLVAENQGKNNRSIYLLRTYSILCSAQADIDFWNCFEETYLSVVGIGALSTSL